MLAEDEEDAASPALVEKQAWPKTAVEQLEAITALGARGVTTESGLMTAFKRADKKIVARHLETLVMLREVGARLSGGAGRSCSP